LEGGDKERERVSGHKNELSRGLKVNKVAVRFTTCD
jgi:hypothetical protein